jgi:hypothetical protein
MPHSREGGSLGMMISGFSGSARRLSSAGARRAEALRQRRNEELSKSKKARRDCPVAPQLL